MKKYKIYVSTIFLLIIYVVLEWFDWKLEYEIMSWLGGEGAKKPILTLDIVSSCPGDKSGWGEATVWPVDPSPAFYTSTASYSALGTTLQRARQCSERGHNAIVMCSNV